MPSLSLFFLVISLWTLLVFFSAPSFTIHVASFIVRLFHFYELFALVSSVFLQSFENGRYQPALRWSFYRVRLFWSFSWKFPLSRWSHYFCAYSCGLCNLGCAPQAVAVTIASFARQIQTSGRNNSMKSTDSLTFPETPLSEEVGFFHPSISRHPNSVDTAAEHFYIRRACHYQTPVHHSRSEILTEIYPV